MDHRPYATRLYLPYLCRQSFYICSIQSADDIIDLTRNDLNDVLGIDDTRDQRHK